MNARWTAAMVSLAVAVGCQPSGDRADAAQVRGDAPAAVLDDAAKIRQAESAAPEAISRHATIMDWPETEGGEMRTLRDGTNRWVCHPSTPVAVGAADEDPMCLDEQWQQFVHAWATRTQPGVTGVGIGYMLRGDAGASNIDPFATGPTPDNEWVTTPPHIMVIVPDPAQLEGFTSDPSPGGPYVMWRGTPYAHIMVPVNQ
jgi:hypothetical protein